MASSKQNSHISMPSTLGGLNTIRREIINFFNMTAQQVETWYNEWLDLSGRVSTIENDGVAPLYPIIFDGGGPTPRFDGSSGNVFFFGGATTRNIEIVNAPFANERSFRMKLLIALDNGGAVKLQSVDSAGTANLQDFFVFNPTVGDELSNVTGTNYVPWNYIQIQSTTSTNRSFAMLEITSIRTGGAANELRLLVNVEGTNNGMPGCQIDVLGTNV